MAERNDSKTGGTKPTTRTEDTRTARTASTGRKVGKLELQDGKVYLMDTRNGRVHQYEDTLAQMAYMQRFVQGEDTTVSRIDNYQPGYTTTTTAADRAAEWDKRAAMNDKQRKDYDAKADKSGEPTATGVVTTASGQPASTPQTLTVAVPESGATRSTEQAQTDASAAPAAPETASGVVGATRAPAPPPPPASGGSESGSKDGGNKATRTNK